MQVVITSCFVFAKYANVAGDGVNVKVAYGFGESNVLGYRVQHASG